ncbi:MAG: WecB/TagA/CpsF family glycosyltransferase, partial [Candidatus Uhrbacteria bacterium]|nr:WecB/TagA/CpsF family glycosyltransferase [Candidatus Uhrbacteria bacterium]
KKLWIVTANPEILLKAKKDQDYREAISAADLRTVDGYGLYLVTEVLRLAKLAQDVVTLNFFRHSILRRKTERLTGVDLAEHLLQYAWKHHLRVGLLGGEDGAAEAAAVHVRDAYPDLEVLVEEGGRVAEDGTEGGSAEAARERMMIFSPQVLLVAFGHPRQERWIASRRNEFADLRAVVGVGGTFNIWAGRIKRAPSWMRAGGIEWLWRLLQEPRRWRRIWDAVVVFPMVALIDQITRKE